VSSVMELDLTGRLPGIVMIGLAGRPVPRRQS
jgi:hypothetical protein